MAKKRNNEIKNYGGNITSDKYRQAGGSTKNKTNYVVKEGQKASPINARGSKVKASVKIDTGKIGGQSAGTVTGKQKVKTNRAGTKSRTVTKAVIGGKKVKQVAKENFKQGTASVRTRARVVGKK
jgi:hypothetical protein